MKLKLKLKKFYFIFNFFFKNFIKKHYIFQIYNNLYSLYRYIKSEA